MSRWNPTSNSKSVQSNPLLILISLSLFGSSASAAFSIAPPRFLISNSNFTLIDPISTWKLEYPLFFIFPFYPLNLKSQLGLLCSLFLIPILSFYLIRDLSFKDMLPNHPITLINHFNQRLDHILSSINGNGHDRRKDSDENNASHKPISRLRRSVQHQLSITSLTQSNPTPSSSNHKSKSNQKNHSDSSHYPGLYNTGNTCFFNSVVQSVSSCRHFLRYLDNVIDLAEKYDVVTPVTDSIYDLIQELNSPSKQRRAIYPRDLSNSLATLSLQNGTRSLMGAHQQQDSHELFLLLASGIESELIKILKEKERIESESNLGFRGLLNTFTSSQSSSRTNELRKLNPLISILAQRTSCLSCGYSESIRLFPNEEFSLTVPDRTNRYHLEDCFRDFVELEKIEWYCFRCSLRQSLDKINTEVWKLENASSSSSSNGEKKIVNEKGDETSSSINGNANGNENGVQQVIENKLNPSKKRKLREMKKIQTKLKNSISNNLHEDEFHSESLHLTKTNFKLEKSLSRESTKQIMICKPPSILSIHLNRSNYSSYSAYGGPSKNNCRIFFEEFLDLGKFVLDGDSLTLDGRKSISDPQGLLELQRNSNQYLNGNGIQRKGRGNYKPIWYKLKSIVVHYGGHSFGHYVSFRRRPTITSEDQEQLHRDLKDDFYNQPQSFVNGHGHGYLDEESRFKNKAREDENWDRISDDSVDRCHLNDVLNQNPFLLFYEKVEESQIQSSNSTKMTNGFQNGEVLNVPKGLERLSNRKLDAGDVRVLERWQEGLKERGANRSYQDEGEVH